MRLDDLHVNMERLSIQRYAVRTICPLLTVALSCVACAREVPPSVHFSLLGSYITLFVIGAKRLIAEPRRDL